MCKSGHLCMHTNFLKIITFCLHTNTSSCTCNTGGDTPTSCAARSQLKARYAGQFSRPFFLYKKPMHGSQEEPIGRFGNYELS
jgi:hypothetical protein